MPIICARPSWSTLRMTLLVAAVAAIICQQQKRPCQAFFAGVEKLADEVFSQINHAPQSERAKEAGYRRIIPNGAKGAGASIRATRLSAMQVTVATRARLPSRQPSPQKSPGPSTPRMPSLPWLDTTVIWSCPS